TEGPVAPPNYVKRMQRLRRKAGVAYSQNSARHCFASYHIAFHGDASKTAFWLGHPNPTLLYSTYRELVTFEEAKAYWDIVPFAALVRRKTEELARDASERDQAEMQSNIFRAIKLEHGGWVPIIEEDAPAPYAHEAND